MTSERVETKSKAMKRITVGSRAFFSGISGFESKDRDYLELVENPTGFNWRHECSLRGICIFRYKKESAAQMVQRTLDCGDPLLVGKFLVPEVAEAIGATVEDILPLEALLDKLDEKHKYLAAIFEAVKQNGGFSLTDEQREAAYEVYREARQPDEKPMPGDEEAQEAIEEPTEKEQQ